MTREWFTLGEIAAAIAAMGAAPELPASRRALARLAAGWRGKARRRAGRGGGWQYHVSVLPAEVRARLAAAEAPPKEEAPWERFEAASKHHKEAAERRLAIIAEAEARERAGMSRTAANRAAAAAAGVSPASLYSWRALVAGVARADRLAALAPGWRATARRAPCHPQAWAAIVSDWLRPERPAFSACYRRMAAAAAAEGWAPVPSERALRRRLEAEVPRAARALARDGREAAKSLYPAQRRVKNHLHAMQAVNADGHRLDVFARFDDGRIGRPCLLAIQDLYSGMIVAWRLAETESRETVRLAIGDMVEAWGIPERCWLDNGRGFASKWITGGTPTRYRFKVRDDEPAGLLTRLGVEVHWTTPYCGQAKPIERAFRDLAEEIARHPVCAGAYCGNRPDAKPENYGSRAIAVGDLAALVADRVAEHNGRPGRRTQTAQGRSFAETFQASYAEAIVRRASPGQRALWLLAAERVRAQKGSGEIHLLSNRYWAPAMNALAGAHVTVRFDPGRLDRPVRVYDDRDRLICEAERLADAAFDDIDAARRHAEKRNRFMRAAAEQRRLAAELSAEALARIYSAAPPEPARPRPAAVRLARPAAQAAAQAVAQATAWDDEAEAAFSRALRLVVDNDEP